MKRPLLPSVIVLVAIVALGALLYWWIPSDSVKHNQTTSTDLVTKPISQAEEATPISSTRLVEYTITPEETIGGIMNRVGVPPEESRNIIEKTESVYALSQIHVGKILKFIFAQEALASVEYPISDEEVLVVRREGEDFVAMIEPLPIEVRERVVKFGIENSFYLDAQKQNVSDTTIMNTADVFRFGIDFESDITTGDTFTILYEERLQDGEYLRDGMVLGALATVAGKQHKAYRFEDAYYDEEGNSLARAFLRTPLAYGSISSGYTQSRVNPVTRVVQPHRAIDYAAPLGTPVYATGDGEVSFSGWKNDALGYTVEIKHAGGYLSQYTHLSKVAGGLKKGSDVKQSETVGYVGSTGMSTGPHLQYALFKDSTPVNPLSDDLPIGTTLEGEKYDDFIKTRETLQAKLSGNIN
jgi:murein DD-endopeptidase MepM/ murein hydrolase activator NlpD